MFIHPRFDQRAYSDSWRCRLFATGAGTELKPHEGYQGKFLRMHLGLIIPQGDMALRSLDETRGWEEGKVFIFDDRQEHEAWNRTKEARVILLIDFIPKNEG